MRHGVRICGLATAVALLAACGRPASARSPSDLVDVGAGLRGPAGVHASVYADGLANVSSFALDDRGRLWVGTSGETDHSNDAVFLVASAGTAPVKIITGLRGPIGLAWYQGSLYVASIGRLDAYGGLSGTRFTDHRLILRGPVAGAMNGGLTLLPDGRFLMSVATSCDHCTPTSRWSATIVSFDSNGSNLRVYATGVRDAFGITYDASARQVLATLNQRDDLGSRTSGDWLAIVKQDDDWGFPSCYGQGGTECAGVHAPAAVLDRHAGAGGVAILSGALAGSPGRSVLAAEWATGVVLLARLPSTQTSSSTTAGDGTVTTWATGFKAPLAVLSWPGRGVLIGDWSRGIVYLFSAT